MSGHSEISYDVLDRALCTVSVKAVKLWPHTFPNGRFRCGLAGVAFVPGAGHKVFAIAFKSVHAHVLEQRYDIQVSNVLATAHT